MRSNTHFRTAFAAFILIASARVCFAVDCGETILTDETLTADLNCATEPALTIGDGGSLDLNAFKVTCNGTQNGIVLNADKASVSNGSVGDCTSNAIVLNASGHKITGMYVFDSNKGIVAPNSTSSGIKIKDTAMADVIIGIELYGSEHSIAAVSIIASYTGITLDGAANKLKDVTITNATFRSVDLNGAGGNKLNNVRVTDAQTGLRAGGGSNKLANIHSANYTLDGIELRNDGNKLTGSTLIAGSGSDPYGVYVSSGTGNSVSKCAAMAGVRGIMVGGTASAIAKNRVFGGSAYGIYAATSAASISGNVGLGSATYDLYDAYSDCNGNVWSKNLGKKGQTCIH